MKSVRLRVVTYTRPEICHYAWMVVTRAFLSDVVHRRVSDGRRGGGVPPPRPAPLPRARAALGARAAQRGRLGRDQLAAEPRAARAVLAAGAAVRMSGTGFRDLGI